MAQQYNNNNSYGHYYSIPVELTKMSDKNDQVIYEVPNCDNFYDQTSSHTDLSLHLLDLSITSDLDDDDDFDFSGSDDFDERQTSSRRRHDVISVIDEDDEEDEDGDLLIHNVGTGQFMLDLLDRITPSTPPTDSSSNECTPTSSKGTSTSSSSSSHGRYLEFDSDFKSGSSPNSEGATTEQETIPSKKKSKLKRAVPRMGTRLDAIPRPTDNLLDNLFFPPPPPLSSSPKFQTLFQSAIPSLSPPSSPHQQHVYQDLVFDYSEARVDDHFNNNNSCNEVTQNEAFYHVLSPDLVLQQKQQDFKRRKHDSIKRNQEHKVTFDLMRSSDEDIYENDYEVKSLLKGLSPDFIQLPPPLPKRPTQVKFTPIIQNFSSPTLLRHSNQVVQPTSQEISYGLDKGNLRKDKCFLNEKSCIMPKNVSYEKSIRMGSRKHKDQNRIRSNCESEAAGVERKVVVIGEDGVDGGRGEIYGKLAEIMYTNSANLHHTIMLQQKLFQQQLRAGPNSRKAKSQLVPNSQDMSTTDQLKLALQNPWNVLPEQDRSPRSKDWIIRVRHDGTRYITRRNKHSRTRESKTPQREVDKYNIPTTTPQTIMPIFRTRRNKDKNPAPVLSETNNHSTPSKPMVHVDSFVALQNVLQGKMIIQNHLIPQKPNHNIAKPLLSVTTI